jgi:hypothetical protein
MPHQFRITMALVIRSAVMLVLLSVGASSVRAIDPPPMGGENRIDHGFRYEVDLGWLDRSAIAFGDSVVLFANRSASDYSISGWRYTFDGRGLDADHVILSPPDGRAGPFDISGFDGNGWKLAYLADGLTDWHSLLLRNLDPATLVPIGSDLLITGGGGGIGPPAIAWNGEDHLLAWVESGIVKLARIRPDMIIEDPVPNLVGSGASSVAIAADSLGGIVAWRSGNVSYRFLDRDGLPTGDEHVISLFASPTAVDVSRFSAADSTWIITWSRDRGVFCAVVNADGEIDPPGIGVLSEDWSIAALSVAGHADSALVAWQVGDAGPVRAAVVSPSNDAWGIHAIELSAYSPLWDWDGVRDPRSIDCAWTGDRYAVSWCTRAPLETKAKSPSWMSDANRQRDSHGGSTTRALIDESSAAFARLITPRGDPVSPVFEVNMGSMPYSIGLSPSGDGYLATLWDGYGGGRYVHTQLLDAAGGPSSPPQRYATPVYDTECDIYYCEWSYVMGAPRFRSVGQQEGVLLYGYDSGWDDQYGAFEDRDGLVVDILRPDGALNLRTGVGIDYVSGEYRPLARPTDYDVARGSDSHVFALSIERFGTPDTSRVEAVRRTFDGNDLTFWHVASAEDCRSPSIATVGERFLLMWLEGSDAPQLRMAVLDPANSGIEITGEPVIGSLAVEGSPFLVPGPGQVLAVFPGRIAGGDYDVYAMRFGIDGAPLDTLPIHIGTDPGNQGDVCGVWDGNQYVIAWSNLDPGEEAILGCRLTSDGLYWDTTPWVIHDGLAGTVSLASSAYAQVLAAYGGNITRSIDDEVPLLLDDGPGGWPWPAEVRIGRIVPNPARGSVRLDIEIPSRIGCAIDVFDAGGRRVHAFTTSPGALLSGWRWDGRRANGEPAPTGVYFVRVRAGGRETIRRALLIR